MAKDCKEINWQDAGTVKSYRDAFNAICDISEQYDISVHDLMAIGMELVIRKYEKVLNG